MYAGAMPKLSGTDRDEIRQAMEAENIEARPVWKPMHLQPVFKGCRMYGGAVGEELFRIGLCLPSGTALGDPDLDRIAAVVRGSRTGSVPGRLQKVLENIDDKYAIELVDWEGDLDKLRGVRDETNLVFERESFFPKKEKKG